MKRHTKLDWLICSIFRWWWNPIYRKNLNLWYRQKHLENIWVEAYVEKRNEEIIREAQQPAPEGKE